jgi:hypothetical protein
MLHGLPAGVSPPAAGGGIPGLLSGASGTLKWQGHRLFLSDALIGEPVGLLAIDNDLWRIEFGPVPLALYHTATQQFVKL